MRTDQNVDPAESGAAAVGRAHSIIHQTDGRYRFTDLTKTSLEGVESRYFRLFTPVKRDRMRLPTSLPEFWDLRHRVTLSDSPVTAADRLGGHWIEYNLAAIAQVAACNLRCSYCYVDYRHLGGHDSFACDPGELVEDFVRIRERLAARGRQLSILRISGGEPLLAPGLVAGVDCAMNEQGLHGECVLKVESNLTALRQSFDRLTPPDQKRFREVAEHVIVHATLHAKPGAADWRNIRTGLEFAISLGIDLYPAIGGADWTETDMRELHAQLAGINPALPSRLAVRPFDLHYVDGYNRRKLPHDVHGSGSASETWEVILREAGGGEYLTRPRHEVRLR